MNKSLHSISSPLIDHSPSKKRNLGQYFTHKNPFNTPAFFSWAKQAKIQQHIVLEPFAGSNNLVHMLQDMNLCQNFQAFDIHPQAPEIQTKNTLLDFPSGYHVCVTNPPYLAKNSATRRKLSFPTTSFDDLYKYALDKCLQHCPYVAAIVPASLLNSNLFRNRLCHYILLNRTLFQDTEHPVCLALFEPSSREVNIWEYDSFLGHLSTFSHYLPNPNRKIPIRFNDPNGSLGLIAIDNTMTASIRFCVGSEISSNRISHSSRSLTRIHVPFNTTQKVIERLNHELNQFRQQTHDIFLTPFKGSRQDGKMRRRLDFCLAKQLITAINP